MAYFVFNGYHSYYDLGIICADVPYPPQAYQGYTYINIPKRTIPIKQKNQYFGTKEINIMVINSKKSNTDTIYSVIFGEGKLILSTCLDRYFNVTVNQIVPQFALKTIDKIPLSFTAEPFAYSINNDVITLTEPTTINVDGNIYTEPCIKVYGSGDGTLTINDDTISFYGMNEYIILDTPRLLAYKDNQIVLNKTFGNLPILRVGDNLINWSGGVTSIEVTKNERWL
ncbi:MAG: hypothetical protein ACI4WH_07730 [Oscillospiraceae bacterium]